MTSSRVLTTSDFGGASAEPLILAKRRRFVIAAAIGNALEWYDFLVYGLLAGTIAKLFFPTENELSSLLLSLGTFGVGLVMRPVGAIALGVYADRVGRKAALTVTIFIMALGTGLVAIAPTYEAIGIWAPLLIVFARLLQGFSCGGEPGSAIAFLAENAPQRQRGLYASWLAATQHAGFLLGAIVTMALTLALTPAEIEAGGWRWPFVFGLLIAPVGLYMRSKLDEPDLFVKTLEAPRPIAPAGTLQRESSSMLLGVGVSLLYVVSAYLLFVYMPTFAVRQLQLPFSAALGATVAAVFVAFVGTPIAAAISDQIGRKPMLSLAAFGYLVLAYPAFAMLIAHPSIAALTAVQVGSAVLMATYGGPVISVLAELFPTRRRSTGVAIAYNVVAVFAGFAPFVVTWLIAVTGDLRAPAFYVIGAAAVSSAALVWLRDRYREPLQ